MDFTVRYSDPYIARFDHYRTAMRLNLPSRAIISRLAQIWKDYGPTLILLCVFGDALATFAPPTTHFVIRYPVTNYHKSNKSQEIIITLGLI